MRRFPLALFALVALSGAACGSAAADVDGSVAREAPVATSIVETSTSVPLPTSTVPTSVGTATSAPPVPTTAVSTTTLGRPTVRGGAEAVGANLASDGTPTFQGEFADPFLLQVGTTFYAYATNTFTQNVPVLAARGDGTGGALGDALPELPVWSERFNVWAPAVTAIGDTYVMHYTTRHTASGRQCISVAVASAPEGPFVDDSDEPLLCAFELGGAIDPSVIEVDGDLWLLWKSDGNCCGIPTMIFSQPLTVDGLELAGEHIALISNDLWWERDVVEGPSMIEHDGVFHLFYSANRWDTEAYAVGHAVCETVVGPCEKDPEPWLADTAATSGPGGLEAMAIEGRRADLVVYHGWTGDDVGYPEGSRSLYVRPIRWVDGQPVLVGD